MPFVLDASTTLSWFLDDEINQQHTASLRLLAQDCALVPSLWPVQVGNSLNQGVKSGRISDSRRAEILHQLRSLDIRIDVVHPMVERLSFTAEKYRLTTYDCTYLLLAMDRGIPLATLDKELIRAARRSSVALI